MPTLDNRILIERDKQPFDSGPEQFAEAIETSFSPEKIGTWEMLENRSSLWRMRIISAGALSLNFAFTGYYLPEGARLRIYSPTDDYRLGPFTATDVMLLQ